MLFGRMKRCGQLAGVLVFSLGLSLALAGCQAADSDTAASGAVNIGTEDFETVDSDISLSDTSGFEDSADTSRGSARVFSGDQVIEPEWNITYYQKTEKGKTFVGEAGYLKPADIEEMPEIVYGDDLRVEFGEEPYWTILCTFYDDKNQELSGYGGEIQTAEELVFPELSEAYVAELQVSFGDEKSRNGYQYFFKVLPAGSPAGGQAEVVIPDLRVTWGDTGKEIPWASGGYTSVTAAENGTGENETVIACGADPLWTVAKSGEEVPYVPLDKIITITFTDGSAPDTVTVLDLIADEGGNAKYGSETTITREVTLEGDQARIYLGTNPYALLSSDSATYEKGGVVRGFYVKCSWQQGSTADYGFLVRTDAAMGNDGTSGGAYLMIGCGTGIPVLGNIDAVKEKSGKTVVTMSLSNQMSATWTYGVPFLLDRQSGDERQAVPYREGYAWEDVAYTLKGGKSVKQEVCLEDAYGELEPGYYVLTKEMTNERTGETEYVSAGFVLVE